VNNKSPRLGRFFMGGKNFCRPGWGPKMRAMRTKKYFDFYSPCSRLRGDDKTFYVLKKCKTWVPWCSRGMTKKNEQATG